MNKKFLALLSFVLVLSLIGAVSAQPAAGVKKGDWIEYKVTYTGSPSPDHSIASARMEVLDVSAPLIYVNILATYANGTQENTKSTLNLQTGTLIDDFIIPANLTTGDSFYDSRVGNINITNTKQDTYAGATRTVISATSGGNAYIWDQLTGVSVEGNSIQPDYTMHTIVTATNLWQSSGLDPVIIYATIVIVAIIIAASAFLLYTKRKRKTTASAAASTNPPPA
jgi:hypothetical protein